MQPSLDDLARRVTGLARPGMRVVVGIAGMPGAGKSTLTARLLGQFATRPPPGEPRPPAGHSWVGHLPMDGFHLPQERLVELGRRHRMGAPETFDASAYADTVEAIVGDPTASVPVPGFDRMVEEPVPAATRIEPWHQVVLTEGNYLLLPEQPWTRAREAMAEVWYVDLPEATRVRRLLARHVEFGKTPAAAREWVARSDQANARRVAAARDRCDLVVALE